MIVGLMFADDVTVTAPDLTAGGLFIVMLFDGDPPIVKIPFAPSRTTASPLASDFIITGSSRSVTGFLQIPDNVSVDMADVGVNSSFRGDRNAVPGFVRSNDFFADAGVSVTSSPYSYPVKLRISL